MTSSNAQSLLETKPDFGYTFDAVGTPIEPEVRPIWRIALVTVILSILGRGGKANPRKLLVLSSIVSSERKRELLRPVLDGKTSPLDLNIRFDPSLDRAIDFGIAEKLFALDSANNVELTEAGEAFAKKILADDDLFVTEREFLNQFKKSDFTENTIEKLVAG